MLCLLSMDNLKGSDEVNLSMHKIRMIRNFFLGLIIFVLVFLLGYEIGGRGSLDKWLDKSPISVNNYLPTSVNLNGVKSDAKVDMNLFWHVWDQVKTRYIDKNEVDEQKMILGAIKGMVSGVGDPYTVFLTPDENKKSQEDLQGSFGGVGIQLGYYDIPETVQEERLISVVAPLEGTPAFRAGIKTGEIIVAIDGKSASGISVPQAVELIRGPKGSSVTLSLVEKIGESESRDVVLVRDDINVPSVNLEFVDHDGSRFANLRVSRFGDKTTEELLEASKLILEEYKQGKIIGIMLDLRGNPGGYFQKAIEMVSLFVKSGVVVQQEDATGQKQQFKALGNAVLSDIPLVILVDKGSASSSEITAGAIRELRNIKLVGTTTFGKGTVQAADELAGGSGLHITIQRWLLPSGASIHKVGVKPDEEVEYEAGVSEDDLDSQQLKAVEMLKNI